MECEKRSLQGNCCGDKSGIIENKTQHRCDAILWDPLQRRWPKTAVQCRSMPIDRESKSLLNRHGRAVCKHCTAPTTTPPHSVGLNNLQLFYIIVLCFCFSAQKHEGGLAKERNKKANAAMGCSTEDRANSFYCECALRKLDMG